MEELKAEMLNSAYWDSTYDKMACKRELSKEDADSLWKIKEIYRNDIVEKLFSGEYEWSIPRKVQIAKADSKKKRTVYIYSIEDRYILGVIYRCISSYFKDKINGLCFSYKTETSTSSAINYIRDNLDNNFKFGVKVDIHAYFNSISRKRVSEMINELFTGGFKSTLEKLMLTDKVNDNGEIIDEWKSIIPGCALGSFFANYCLTPCDNYFTNSQYVYARYSDDIIVISDDREKIENAIEKIKYFISEYGLELNPNKYKWFEPDDTIQYLGLKINKAGKIDIADHSKLKIKKQIHRWCRKGRMEIERDYKEFNSVAKSIIRKINNKNMFCAVDNDATFGWCVYAFRYINTIESLIEIDRYTRDTLRAMKTGKHNKANVKAITDEEFKALGWVSLVDMFNLYKKDYDYYMEIIEILKNRR